MVVRAGLISFGPVGTGLSSFGAPGQQATSYRAFGLPGARVLPMLCTVHASMLRMGWGWPGWSEWVGTDLGVPIRDRCCATPIGVAQHVAQHVA